MATEQPALPEPAAKRLLPCPFCGKQPRTQQVLVNLFGAAQWEVQCQCGAVSPAFPVKAQAVRWWARREWVLPASCGKR